MLSIITGCQCQGNTFINYLFSDNKFLNSHMILCATLFPNYWNLVYYVAQFYFQWFENWWCIAASYFLNMFWINFQSIWELLLNYSIKEKAVWCKKANLKISWDISIYMYLCYICMYIYIYIYYIYYIYIYIYVVYIV